MSDTRREPGPRATHLGRRRPAPAETQALAWPLLATFVLPILCITPIVTVPPPQNLLQSRFCDAIGLGAIALCLFAGQLVMWWGVNAGHWKDFGPYPVEGPAPRRPLLGNIARFPTAFIAGWAVGVAIMPQPLLAFSMGFVGALLAGLDLLRR